jgi:hypothetical protein
VLSHDAYGAAERFVRFQLGREIALQAGGDAWEFRRMAPQDRVLQRALALFSATRSTDELLGVANDPTLSDWIPHLSAVAEDEGRPDVEEGM